MAMTIQELREKRSKAWDTARDFLDSKRNESGLLSEEDSKTYDAMEQQIDTISSIASRNLQSAQESEQSSGLLAQEADELQNKVGKFTLKEGIKA